MKKLSTDVATTALPYYPAEAVIDDISLEIGGQPIDKHYSDYYRMFDELFRSGDEKAAYRDMTNFDNKLPKEHVKTFYLPLLFFFCQSPGLALPLIALQYVVPACPPACMPACPTFCMLTLFSPDSQVPRG